MKNSNRGSQRNLALEIFTLLITLLMAGLFIYEIINGFSKENIIYFLTLITILLSIMAIYVSYRQLHSKNIEDKLSRIIELLEERRH